MICLAICEVIIPPSNIFSENTSSTSSQPVTKQQVVSLSTGYLRRTELEVRNSLSFSFHFDRLNHRCSLPVSKSVKQQVHNFINDGDLQHFSICLCWTCALVTVVVYMPAWAAGIGTEERSKEFR